MTSQLVIFRAELFYLFFLVPPTLDLKTNSRKSTNKKILALGNHKADSRRHNTLQNERTCCYMFIEP